MKLLLKGGRVIDPAAQRDGAFDILIEDGRIVRVSAGTCRSTEPRYSRCRLAR